MKINEVFEGLAIDEGRVYLTNRHSRRYEISIGENRFIKLRAFTSSGQPIESFKGAGGFTGNLRMGDEWELKREKVDFLTAANSGKPISSVCEKIDIKRCSIEWLLRSGYLKLEHINGLWEIE